MENIELKTLTAFVNDDARTVALTARKDAYFKTHLNHELIARNGFEARVINRNLSDRKANESLILFKGAFLGSGYRVVKLANIQQ